MKIKGLIEILSCITWKITEFRMSNFGLTTNKGRYNDYRHPSLTANPAWQNLRMRMRASFSQAICDVEFMLNLEYHIKASLMLKGFDKV